MYNPPANRVDDISMINELIMRAGFGHLVSHVGGSFAATGLPMLLDPAAGPHGVLRGHVARANPQWKGLDGAPVLVVFPLTDGYVSPAWYPSKVDDPKVVPTWNYEVVHAHGIVRVHDDPTWVLDLVTSLTEHHESTRTDEGRTWAVSDAPDEFVDRQVRAIVGVEVQITALEGKRKLSQNRSDDDRLGVIIGNDATTSPSAAGLAAAMRSPST